MVGAGRGKSGKKRAAVAFSPPARPARPPNHEKRQGTPKAGVRPPAADAFETLVSRMGRDGEGVGTAPDGRVAFIKGALPGERVRAQVTEAHQNYVRAALLAVAEAAPGREDPPCPVFGRCGGCAFQHWRYQDETAYKQDRVVQALRRVGHLEAVPVLPTIPAPQPYGYRNKGQFAWALEQGRPVLGLYQSGSHQVVPVTACAIQHPLVNRVVEAAATIAGRLALPVYREASRQGVLRHLLVRVSRLSGTALAVLVVAEDRGHRRSLQAFADGLRAAVPEVAGVLVNVNSDPGNRALGIRTYRVAGVERLPEEILGSRFWMTGPAFFQVNPLAVASLYGVALDWLGEAVGPAAGPVWDVYGGVGTLAVLMARRLAAAGPVVLVEREPTAVRLAQENAAMNGVADRLVFLQAAAETTLADLAVRYPPTAAVVDPPRSGLPATVVEALRVSDAGGLVYVSCHPESLARDGAALCRPDGPGRPFRARRVQPVDMFPRTDHVEAVMLLDRG